MAAGLGMLFLGGCQSPRKQYSSLKERVDRGEFVSTLVEAHSARVAYDGSKPEWSWRFRLLEARILVSRSLHAEALHLLADEPPQFLADTDVAEQRKLYQGIAHRGEQQFQAAEADFREASRLKNGLAPAYHCQLLIAQAALWVDQRDFPRAERDYREALTLAHRSGLAILEADATADLARAATSQGHFDQALDLYSSALQQAHLRRLKGTEATILGNLGWSYFELGDFELARDYYARGAEASAGDGLSGYSAYWFGGVAKADLALHDPVSAEKLALDTLQHARLLNNAQTITTTLNTLTDITLRAGRVTEAKQYNREARTIEESGEDQLDTAESVVLAGRIAEAEKRYDDAEAYFLGILRDNTIEPPLRWSAEAGMARIRQDQSRTGEAENLYLQAIDIVEQARRSIQRDELRLSFLSSGIAVYGEYVDFLMQHGRSSEALRQAELSRARTLAEALANAGPRGPAARASDSNPQQLAKRLRATLLLYWLGEKHSYLWAVTSNRTEAFTLPASSDIVALVKTYRQMLAEGHDVLRDREAEGEKLYATLVAPARKLIPRGGRVMVLPDASLYSLNFETLIVPEPQPHFWIEDVTVSVTNSLTLLTASASHPASQQKSLFLVGDTMQASSDFPVLRQAPREMKLVEKHFPETHRLVLAQQQATPSAYLASHPEQYSYLHFVTHGIASRTRPLESAVILSPEGDSYKLYAHDIVTRQLHAELVTISACNGSGIRAYSGEGLVGLSWAFLRAGAHNVIGALWEVSDTATPQLMDKLYSGIAEGDDPASALRNAKLAFLHSGNVYAKPFYWAPFQIYSGS